MKKSKVKLSAFSIGIGLLILLATLLAFVPLAKVDSQAFNPYQASIKAKQDLVARTRHNARVLSAQEAAEQQHRYDEIMSNRSLDYQTRETQLNEIGYYTYRDRQQLDEKSYNGDVFLSGVGIVYNSVLDQWTLSGTGYWKNSTWNEGISVLGPSVGQKHDLGGWDAAGICFYNTEGSTSGLGVVSGLGTLTNGEHQYDVTNPNRTWLNSTEGNIYELQDKILITKVNHFLGIPTTYEYKYLATSFEVTVTYNGAFANYSGVAKFVYAHTWKKTRITSIGIGVIDINVTWTNDHHLWKGASPNDTIFKRLSTI